MGADATRDGFIRLPIRGMPKARPIVTGRNTFMPPDYTAWKEQVIVELQAQGVLLPNYDVPRALKAMFGTDYIEFQLFPLEGHVRAKHVKGDIDNLTGGLMDALEQGDVIKNDRLIVRTDIWLAGR